MSCGCRVGAESVTRQLFFNSIKFFLFRFKGERNNECSSPDSEFDSCAAQSRRSPGRCEAVAATPTAAAAAAPGTTAGLDGLLWRQHVLLIPQPGHATLQPGHAARPQPCWVLGVRRRPKLGLPLPLLWWLRLWRLRLWRLRRLRRLLRLLLVRLLCRHEQRRCSAECSKEHALKVVIRHIRQGRSASSTAASSTADGWCGRKAHIRQGRSASSTADG